MAQKITEWSIEAADGSWYTAWSVRGRSALQYYRGWETSPVHVMSQQSIPLKSIEQVGEEQITQFREFSKIYNKMSELCFNECVFDFGTSEVRNREERCAMSCTEKYMKATKAMGSSFTETHPANNLNN